MLSHIEINELVKKLSSVSDKYVKGINDFGQLMTINAMSALICSLFAVLLTSLLLYRYF